MSNHDTCIASSRGALGASRRSGVCKPLLYLSTAFALTLGPAGYTSPAFAVCTFVPGPGPTIGDDTATCNDASGAVNLLAGNDKITLNNGAAFTGNITGSVGNDLIVINGGTSTNNITAGTGTASQGDIQDRIFMFDGTITGGEVQIGSGQNNFFFFMGGTIQKNANNAGSIEINRGSVNSVLVFDGGTVNLDEGIEVQSGNAGLNAGPKDPTIYFRSGVYEAGELELVGTDFGGSNPTSFTVIIDPINSKDPAFFQALANNATNGADTTLSTANLNALLFSAPANPDANHQMIFKTEEIEFGNGYDRLIFDGAVNNGPGHHNLVLQGAEEAPGEFEITALNSGGGIDRLTVTGKSSLLLGEIENFEFLNVGSLSTLILEDDEYNFGTTTPGSGAVYVGGNSTLWLRAPEVVFTTAHFELGGPSGGALFQPARYYNAFDPGSILRIGAPMQELEEDDDDNAQVDDDDEEPFLADVTIKVGNSTFVSAGTIDMVNNLAGDRLTIDGPYSAIDGNLALDSFVKNKSSPTDRLILSGPVSGTTTLYVNNLSETGAFTGKGNGDGIQLVATQGLDPSAFQLGVNNISGLREVISGAFSYQLAIDDSGAYLQSDILDQVPGYVMAGAVADRHVYAGIETLYQRMGELRTGPVAASNLKDPDNADRKVDSVWVRGNFSNYDVDVAKGWDFDSDTNGVLIGVDPSRPVGQEGVIHFGVFGGYNATDSTVDGFTWGHRSPSKVEIQGWTVGGYATYFNRLTPGQGFYADLVGKVDGLNLDISNGTRHTHDSTDAAAYTGSAEIGYGFKFSGGWSLQPNGEITFISVDQGNYESKTYGLAIHPEDADSAVGRLGVQLQDTIYSAGGAAITPYVNFNVLSEFDGGTKVIVGGTPFASDLDGTWYDIGGGVTAAWSTRLALYGNIDYKFGDVEGLGGTAGARVRW